MKKIISVILVLILSCLFIVGCDKGNGTDKNKVPENAPNYSDAVGEYITYGYHSPIPQAIYYDGEDAQYVYDANGNIADFRTVERFKEYLDCGLNTLFIQGNDSYSGGDFEHSQLKSTMEKAQEAGLKRVIVCDSRLIKLCQNANGSTNASFIKETVKPEGSNFSVEGNANGTYATYQDALNAVKGWLKEYIAHPVFFGVMLLDEPQWPTLPQVALTYRLVKEAFKVAKAELEGEGKTVNASDIYVQSNLLPMGSNDETIGWYVDTTKEENKDITTMKQAYTRYLEKFCEISGSKLITVDSYPIRQQGSGDNAEYFILGTHFDCIQIMRDVANKYGASLGGVADSCEMTRDIAGTSVALKGPDFSEMYWQINAYLAFGVEAFSYYTYWAKTSNGNGGYHLDGTSFINRDGSKGPLYDVMTVIHSEIQALAPILMQFKHLGVNYFKSARTSYPTTYLSGLTVKENFEKLASVSVGDDSVALVSEFYDEARSQYMYMVMNPQAPSNAKMKDNDGIALSATLDFGEGYKSVMVLYRGETTYLPLNKGKIQIDLSAGFGAFVLPF